jgi:hypothetical protein
MATLTPESDTAAKSLLMLSGGYRWQKRDKKIISETLPSSAG